MAKKNQSTAVSQTALGNDNIQVVGSHNVITRITNFFAGEPEQQRALRDRRSMLELVKNTWIKGVLEKSLYNEILIDLGMEERPGAINHPWDVQVQMPNRINRSLPPGVSMMEVFDGMNGALLILGEPGSGKTTMLLELARDCINRAQQDDNQPIPVIFNLSSWSANQILDQWLVGEMVTRYFVPRKIAQNWVTNADILVLLDGLDEVRPDQQEACVKAINDFRQSHGLSMPLAVCSRIADYEALTAKLNLAGAVLLQPLMPEQVDEYFQQAGAELEGVHQILMRDEMLKELALQPLMLSIMTLAYQGRSAGDVAGDQTESMEIRRGRLFDTYIQMMFERFARTKNEDYAPDQTRSWLSWLAKKIIANNQVPYLLENMQPQWQDLRLWKIRLINGLFGALAAGLSVSLIGALSFGPVLWLMGTINNLIFPWIDEEVSGGIQLNVSFVNGVLGGLVAGLLFGLVIGLIYGLMLKPDRIEMVDKLTWDWKKGTRGLIIGLLLGGLLLGLMDGLAMSWQDSISNLMVFVVSGALIGAAVCGLIFGLTARPISETTYAGQRISLSVKNFFIVLLMAGPVSGLLGGVFLWLLSGLFGQAVGGFIIGIAGGQVLGLISGPIGGLKFGGGAVIQHYVLRSLISVRKHLPWRIIPFLNYATERIFLRKVGGG